MNAAFDDERLSAYLDGELSPDERRALEARITESSELRQALDELRAVGSAVQGLPRHRLDDGFSSAVLRRAELEMLTGRAGDGVPRGGSVAPAAPAGGGEKRRPINLRALLWTAATIGAAVVLWDHFQSRRAGVDVAREKAMAEKPAAKEPPSALKDAPIGAPTPTSTVSAVPATKAPDGESNVAGRKARGAGVARESLSDGPPAPEAKLTDEIADAKEAFKADRRSFAAGKAVPAERSATRSERRLDDVADGRAVGEPVRALGAQSAVNQIADTLTASDSVVVCEITPEAANSGLVYHLLAANSIHPADESHAGLTRAKESKAAAADFKSEKRAEDVATPSAPTPNAPATKSAAGDEAAKAKREPAFQVAGETEMLEIDATPDQIMGFLAQMRQRPAQVTAVHQLQRANMPVGTDVLRKSVTLRGAPGAVAAPDDRALEEKKSAAFRRSRNGSLPLRKSAPKAAEPAAEEKQAEKQKRNFPAADAPGVAESAPRPERPGVKSATEPEEIRKEVDAKGDAPKAAMDKDAKPGEKSRLAPAAPSASADKTTSATRGNQDVRQNVRARRAIGEGATGGEVAGEQAAQMNKGVYRRFNVQQAVPDNQGNLRQGQRDKAVAEGGRGGAADRAQANLRAQPDEMAAQESMVRQRVVVLIQVRPPAVVTEDSAAQPAPAAKPSAKE